MQDSVATIVAGSPDTSTPPDAIASPETPSVPQVQTPPAAPSVPTVSAVCLKPNRIIGNRVCGQGEAVQVEQQLARRLYSEGVIYVSDITTLGDPAPEAPPSPAAAPTTVEPFAADPLTAVAILRDGLTRLNVVYAKGSTIDVPERTAVQWIVSGSAQLAPQAQLSARGQTYLAKLTSTNPSDFGATY